METLVVMPPIAGVLGLVCAAIIYLLMAKYDAGGEKIKKIAAAIHEGAMVFLHREYTMLALFAGLFFSSSYFLRSGGKQPLHSLSALFAAQQQVIWACLQQQKQTSEQPLQLNKVALTLH